MRNWNSRNSRACTLKKNSFQTTYEELKPVPTIFFTSPYFVFRLPMRNWNWVAHFARLGAVRFQTTYEELKLPPNHLCFSYYRVFRLPMRNWNSRQGRITFWRPRSFQTTYEELKHGVPAWVYARPPSFQTTYEELKPIALLMLVVAGTCFQTTYEELKPTRERDKKGGIWFSDYLWGIETTVY